MHLVRHYIAGDWLDRPDGPTGALHCPATLELTGRVQFGGEAEVDLAVGAARRAFEANARSGVGERIALLGRIADELGRRGEDLALAGTLDMGMPLSGSRLAVGAAVFQFTNLIGILKEFPFREAVGTNLVVREPIGVAALIPPWNYPSLQMAEKVAPALAAGCAVVLKPAEVASHSGRVFAEIMHAAGVPAGLFNMVAGQGSVVGSALSRHPGVDMVAFTGSTGVGIQVQKDAADTVKRVSQELGGKSAHIVLPGCDLDLAVATAVGGVMGNAGQTCAAPTRTLVPAALRDAFLERVRAAVGRLVVGDPMTDVDIGSVANETQWHTVQRYIGIGIDEGATLVAGGLGRPEGLSEGWYVRPTVFADVSNAMRIAREEIFGPVMSIIAYGSVDEAIGIANDSPYGLAGYVTGPDADEALDVAARIRAGQIVVNAAHCDIAMPFGGYKRSGNGRIWGEAGLHEYLETKAVVGSF